MKNDRSLWTPGLVTGLGLTFALALSFSPTGCGSSSGDDDSDQGSPTPTLEPGTTPTPASTLTPSPTPGCMVTDGYPAGKDVNGNPIDQLYVNCCSPAVPTYSEVRTRVFEPTCLHCHNSSLSGKDRNGAPTNVNFDTASAASLKPEYYTHEVYIAYMPFAYPPEYQKNILTSEDKEVFYRWELCGHPE